MTIEDLEDYVKPILKRKPNHVIIHAGTNNLHRDNSQTIMEKMSNVISEIKQQYPTVGITVSSIIHRNDKPLFEKVLQTNNLREQLCLVNNYDFIKNNNIQQICLNAGGLHLNIKGFHTLEANLRNCINY